MKTVATVVAIALSLAVAPAALAAEVVVAGGSGQRSLGVVFAGPLGQSFTAIDTGLRSFGFQFTTLNPGTANTGMVFTLRSGAGLDGAIVRQVAASVVGIPTNRSPGWFDFDLTGTTLTVGAQYTAVLTSTSNRYGLVYGPDINLSTGVALGGDSYAGGRLLATGHNDATCNRGICDTNFRFSTVTATAPVPEPAT